MASHFDLPAPKKQEILWMLLWNENCKHETQICETVP